MKNLIIILLILFLNSLTKGQSYYPFPENNAKWIVNTQWANSSGCSSLYDYQITGDTVINLITYHKLTTVNYIISDGGGWGCSPTTPPFFGEGYIGAFRNDTLNRKVYYYPKDSLQEYLLYDFTLNVGDTIKGYTRNFNHWTLGSNDNNDAVITSIDSVLINGVYRKQWNYTSNPSYFLSGSLIEGIGNTNGLIEGTYSHIDFQNYLSCYLENEIPFYSWGACLVGVDEMKLHEQLNIYPNPFSHSITIQSFEKIEKISVFDVLGKEEIIIENPDVNNIDLSGLTNGVKILKIKTTKNNYFHKISKF